MKVLFQSSAIWQKSRKTDLIDLSTKHLGKFYFAKTPETKAPKTKAPKTLTSEEIARLSDLSFLAGARGSREEVAALQLRLWAFFFDIIEEKRLECERKAKEKEAEKQRRIAERLEAIRLKAEAKENARIERERAAAEKAEQTRLAAEQRAAEMAAAAAAEKRQSNLAVVIGKALADAKKTTAAEHPESDPKTAAKAARRARRAAKAEKFARVNALATEITFSACGQGKITDNFFSALRAVKKFIAHRLLTVRNSDVIIPEIILGTTVLRDKSGKFRSTAIKLDRVTANKLNSILFRVRAEELIIHFEDKDGKSYVLGHAEDGTLCGCRDIYLTFNTADETLICCNADKVRPEANDLGIDCTIAVKTIINPLSYEWSLFVENADSVVRDGESMILGNREENHKYMVDSLMRIGESKLASLLEQRFKIEAANALEAAEADGLKPVAVKKHISDLEADTAFTAAMESESSNWLTKNKENTLEKRVFALREQLKKMLDDKSIIFAAGRVLSAKKLSPNSLDNEIFSESKRLSKLHKANIALVRILLTKAVELLEEEKAEELCNAAELKALSIAETKAKREAALKSFKAASGYSDTLKCVRNIVGKDFKEATFAVEYLESFSNFEKKFKKLIEHKIKVNHIVSMTSENKVNGLLIAYATRNREFKQILVAVAEANKKSADELVNKLLEAADEADEKALARTRVAIEMANLTSMPKPEELFEAGISSITKKNYAEIKNSLDVPYNPNSSVAEATALESQYYYTDVEGLIATVGFAKEIAGKTAIHQLAACRQMYLIFRDNKSAKKKISFQKSLLELEADITATAVELKAPSSRLIDWAKKTVKEYEYTRPVFSCTIEGESEYGHYTMAVFKPLFGETTTDDQRNEIFARLELSNGVKFTKKAAARRIRNFFAKACGKDKIATNARYNVENPSEDWKLISELIASCRYGEAFEKLTAEEAVWMATAIRLERTNFESRKKDIDRFFRALKSKLWLSPAADSQGISLSTDLHYSRDVKASAVMQAILDCVHDDFIIWHNQNCSGLDRQTKQEVSPRCLIIEGKSADEDVKNTLRERWFSDSMKKEFAGNGNIAFDERFIIDQINNNLSDAYVDFTAPEVHASMAGARLIRLANWRRLCDTAKLFAQKFESGAGVKVEAEKPSSYVALYLSALSAYRRRLIAKRDALDMSVDSKKYFDIESKLVRAGLLKNEIGMTYLCHEALMVRVNALPKSLSKALRGYRAQIENAIPMVILNGELRNRALDEIQRRIDFSDSTKDGIFTDADLLGIRRIEYSPEFYRQEILEIICSVAGIKNAEKLVANYSKCLSILEKIREERDEDDNIVKHADFSDAVLGTPFPLMLENGNKLNSFIEFVEELTGASFGVTELEQKKFHENISDFESDEGYNPDDEEKDEKSDDSSEEIIRPNLGTPEMRITLMRLYECLIDKNHSSYDYASYKFEEDLARADHAREQRMLSDEAEEAREDEFKAFKAANPTATAASFNEYNRKRILEEVKASGEFKTSEAIAVEALSRFSHWLKVYEKEGFFFGKTETIVIDGKAFTKRTSQAELCDHVTEDRAQIAKYSLRKSLEAQVEDRPAQYANAPVAKAMAGFINYGTDYMSSGRKVEKIFPVVEEENGDFDYVGAIEALHKNYALCSQERVLKGTFDKIKASNPFVVTKDGEAHIDEKNFIAKTLLNEGFDPFTIKKFKETYDGSNEINDSNEFKSDRELVEMFEVRFGEYFAVAYEKARKAYHKANEEVKNIFVAEDGEKIVNCGNWFAEFIENYLDISDDLAEDAEAFGYSWDEKFETSNQRIAADNRKAIYDKITALEVESKKIAHKRENADAQLKLAISKLTQMSKKGASSATFTAKVADLRNEITSIAEESVKVSNELSLARAELKEAKAIYEASKRNARYEAEAEAAVAAMTADPEDDIYDIYSESSVDEDSVFN